MVCEEATLRRNLQTHPQPVLLLTSRLHRQKTLQKTVGQQGESQIGEPAEMLQWSCMSIQAYRVTEHRRDLEILESTVEINETSYQQKSIHGEHRQRNYKTNKGNMQGFKNNNNFNANKAYNNGPEVQCKFCFGPREIYKIHQLLDENANNPECYTEAKSAKSTAEFVKNWAPLHISTK